MNPAFISRRNFLRVITGLPFVGIVSVCTHSNKKPNLVFVLADQWRASATGYAGDPNVKTPHLDKLAGQSINFSNAVSVCPVCTPYRASLMTGQFPTTTGMFLNDLYLPDESHCLGEVFHNAGYHTAYIGKWHLDGHGRDSFIPSERRQGFQYWKGAECDHNYRHSHYYAGNSKEKQFWEGYDAFAQTQDASQYIDDHAKDKKPFFLFISYGTPHFPHHTALQEYKDLYPSAVLSLPPNVPMDLLEKAKSEASGYYAHCTALDECVGTLLQSIEINGIAENTIFIFTSDHGEMMGAQGQRPCEKQRPWDESIKVPFLLRYPRKHGQTGWEVETPIHTPDLMPTLLSLAGLSRPNTVEGENMAKLLNKKNASKERAVLFMSVSPFAGYHKGKEFRGIRTNRYTYVRDLDGPWLMYDNKTDPYQIKNLIGEPGFADLQKELDSQLWAELKKIGDDFHPREYYLEKWHYEVDHRGVIPYLKTSLVQGPSLNTE